MSGEVAAYSIHGERANNNRQPRAEHALPAIKTRAGGVKARAASRTSSNPRKVLCSAPSSKRLLLMMGMRRCSASSCACLVPGALRMASRSRLLPARALRELALSRAKAAAVVAVVVVVS